MYLLSHFQATSALFIWSKMMNYITSTWFLKVVWNNRFLTHSYFYFFLIFNFLAALRDMRDLSSLTRDQILTPRNGSSES